MLSVTFSKFSSANRTDSSCCTRSSMTASFVPARKETSTVMLPS